MLLILFRDYFGVLYSVSDVRIQRLVYPILQQVYLLVSLNGMKSNVIPHKTYSFGTFRRTKHMS